MTNTTTKTLNSSNLPEQEIGLAEAYAESAIQDKLMAAAFDVALDDGLKNDHISPGQ